ncbi:exodeoxyribonuclease isoform X1 [Athalia rosae]|uniref:exodeoxyribonuclease isoform X1 n=2 Tax=Athalia rosae TaxID=37344 RepID=UPI00203366DD|nr:exodeoxyribonuclease isoform X1 [Athalia rosae]
MSNLTFGLAQSLLLGFSRVVKHSRVRFCAIVAVTASQNNRFCGSSILREKFQNYNLILSGHVISNTIMPPKRGRPAKATKKTKAGTSQNSKTESLDKPTSKKTKRVTSDEDSNDEPVSKKTKVETKKQPMNKTATNLDNIDYECQKTNENEQKYNLKICSWNVSGLRACIKKNGIDYLLKENADIIALQETKCDKNKLPEEVKIPGYNDYFVDSKKSGYCGVALYTKVKPLNVMYGMNIPLHDDEGRMITAEFENFFVVSVYVPNAGQKLVTLPKRLQWNKDFKEFIGNLDKKKPVIICGDMNVAHTEIDLTNPKTNMKNAGFTKEERDDMTNFLEAGFVDTFRQLYPDKTGAYTFWAYFNNARAKNIGWRIDYFLVSEAIKNNVCDNVIRDQVFGSDHCPIVLYIHL